MMTIKCKHCGKEFYKYLQRRVFCSDECSKANRLAESEKLRKLYQSIERPCKRCKKPFCSFNSRKYCPACSNIMKQVYTAKERKVMLVTMVNCKRCDKPTEKKAKNTKYCSKCIELNKKDAIKKQNKQRREAKLELEKLKEQPKKEESLIPLKFLVRGSISTRR